jgi:hypothetical protein
MSRRAGNCLTAFVVTLTGRVWDTRSGVTAKTGLAMNSFTTLDSSLTGYFDTVAVKALIPRWTGNGLTAFGVTLTDPVWNTGPSTTAITRLAWIF